MRCGSDWGGAIEIAICARLRDVNIDVFERSPEGFSRISRFEGRAEGGLGLSSVRVLYGGRCHYDSIEMLSSFKTTKS